jgi:transcriptional regulator with XRE-family HTH domain
MKCANLARFHSYRICCFSPNVARVSAQALVPATRIMQKRLDRYLRPQRRRWGFTQKELAFIIGGKSGTAVSRLEQGRRRPSLAAAFALHILFGTDPVEIFPALFAEIERAVLARAYDLYERLQGDRSKAARMKLDFLEEMFARAKRRGDGDARV